MDNIIKFVFFVIIIFIINNVSSLIVSEVPLGCTVYENRLKYVSWNVMVRNVITTHHLNPTYDDILSNKNVENIIESQ